MQSSEEILALLAQELKQTETQLSLKPVDDSCENKEEELSSGEESCSSPSSASECSSENSVTPDIENGKSSDLLMAIPKKRKRTNYKDPENASKLAAALEMMINQQNDSTAPQRDLKTVSKMFGLPYNTLRDNYLRVTTGQLHSKSKQRKLSCRTDDIPFSSSNFSGSNPAMISQMSFPYVASELYSGMNTVALQHQFQQQLLSFYNQRMSSNESKSPYGFIPNNYSPFSSSDLNIRMDPRVSTLEYLQTVYHPLSMGHYSYLDQIMKAHAFTNSASSFRDVYSKSARDPAATAMLNYERALFGDRMSNVTSSTSSVPCFLSSSDCREPIFAKSSDKNVVLP